MEKDKENIKKELIEREAEAKKFLSENGYGSSDYWRLPNWLLQRIRTLSERL